LRSFRITALIENPLYAGFVEQQHEEKTWTWSGKKTEGQAAVGLRFRKTSISLIENPRPEM
jgi:hypothetical protein